MEQLILTTALTAAVSSIVGAVVASLVAMAKSRAHEASDEGAAVRDGMRCLLRREIIAMHAETVRRGSIEVVEHDHISQVFGAYTALGGNGMAKQLIHEIDQLPIRD